MADKGTIAQLKTSISTVYNNAQSDEFLTPQKHYNMINDVIDTLAPSYGTADSDVVDVYTVAMSVTQIAYSEQKLYLITFSDTNTGAATLNVDGLGVKPLKKDNNIELAGGEDSGDITPNKIYEVRYDSTNDVFIVNI